VASACLRRRRSSHQRLQPAADFLDVGAGVEGGDGSLIAFYSSQFSKRSPGTRVKSKVSRMRSGRFSPSHSCATLRRVRLLHVKRHHPASTSTTAAISASTPWSPSNRLGMRSRNESPRNSPISPGSAIPGIHPILIQTVSTRAPDGNLRKSTWTTAGLLFSNTPEKEARASRLFSHKIRRQKQSWQSGVESYAHDKCNPP
jgi:hypothetical protein